MRPNHFPFLPQSVVQGMSQWVAKTQSTLQPVRDGFYKQALRFEHLAYEFNPFSNPYSLRARFLAQHYQETNQEMEWQGVAFLQNQMLFLEKLGSTFLDYSFLFTVGVGKAFIHLVSEYFFHLTGKTENVEEAQSFTKWEEMKTIQDAVVDDEEMKFTIQDLEQRLIRDQELLEFLGYSPESFHLLDEVGEVKVHPIKEQKFGVGGYFDAPLRTLVYSPGHQTLFQHEVLHALHFQALIHQIHLKDLEDIDVLLWIQILEEINDPDYICVVDALKELHKDPHAFEWNVKNRFALSLLYFCYTPYRERLEAIASRFDIDTMGWRRSFAAYSLRYKTRIEKTPFFTGLRLFLGVLPPDEINLRENNGYSNRHIYEETLAKGLFTSLIDVSYFDED